jgi:hypothetical protein
MITDKSGNVYVAGYAEFSGSGEDMLLIKYNASGIQQWAARYNGPGNSDDRAFGIVVDDLGNIIITGYSTGVGSSEDYTTVKYTTEGQQIWVSRYNTPINGDDRAFGIVVDRVGNIYVTGYITLANKDIYTIKYTANGVYVWGHVLTGNGNGEDRSFGIVVDDLGNNIYLCGFTTNDTSAIDFTTASYDSSGVNNWVRNYKGAGTTDDKAFGIVVDSDQNILVTGYSTGGNSGKDFTTIKYNSAGDTLRVRKKNGTGNGEDKSFGIVVDEGDNCYITGNSIGDTTESDYLTVKYDSTGLEKWATRYNGTANYQDTSYAVCYPKNSEYVYVTGGSSSDTIPGKLDILTVKYNVETGEESQFSRYVSTSNLNDAGVCITADTSGNVFVAGYTQDSATGYNMLTEKFLDGGLAIGINIISAEVPQNFRLYQNYPNPFNPSTRIKFDIGKSANVKITLYDITGRQVSILVNEAMKTGSYEVSLTANSLASGIYFYELAAEDYRETKKMILLK